jgi:phosphofructokinase-like protein
MTKRIGILTSGGDCSGLNAAIRAITVHAIEHYGWEVFGILKGTSGLIRRPMEYVSLTLKNCDSSMLRSAGTILESTTKENPFFFPGDDGSKADRSDDAIIGYRDLNLDAIIAIGGDGSMRINSRLAKKGGMNLVCIPKTIDNDLAQTDYSIGYHTAITVATEAMDRLQPTAASHQRVMILEVMGRDAGHIALASGIAGGTDVILVPEIPYKIESICEHIKNINKAGRNFALITVSEAIKTENGEQVVRGKSINERPRYGGVSQYLSSEIESRLNADTRFTVLGHVQRGGQPTAQDRILATVFGVKAVDMVAEQDFGKMVAWRNNQVEAVPIDSSIDTYNGVDPNGVLIKTAKAMGIYVGEI